MSAHHHHPRAPDTFLSTCACHRDGTKCPGHCSVLLHLLTGMPNYSQWDLRKGSSRMDEEGSLVKEGGLGCSEQSLGFSQGSVCGAVPWGLHPADPCRHHHGSPLPIPLSMCDGEWPRLLCIEFEAITLSVRGMRNWKDSVSCSLPRHKQPFILESTLFLLLIWFREERSQSKVIFS